MSISFYTSYIEPMTTWLNQHPHWAGFLTFLISFSESLAIVGSIVPGSVTMTAIGMLIGSGVIPCFSIFMCATLGAIAGDSASYFLGYYYHQKIASWWPFSKHPQMLASGNDFFKQHGGKSVFIGRFLGPLRSIIPVIAGMMRMPNSKFLVANITSAILWSALYITPGIIIGNAAAELSPHLATKLLLYILGVIAAVWMVTWLIKFLIKAISTYIDNHLSNFWGWLNKHPSLKAWSVKISNPRNPQDHRQIALLLFAILFLVLFCCVAVNDYHHGFITYWDKPIFSFLQSIRLPSLDTIFMTFSFIGDKKTLLPILFGVFFFFLYSKQYWEAGHWLSNGIVSAILIYVLKPFLNLPRPAGLVQIRHGSSFPSGHTTFSMAVFGFLVYLVSKNTPKDMRRFIVFPGVTLISGIAFSRIYMGMHWFSDIIGSFFLAGGLLFLHMLSYQRGEYQKINIQKLLVIAFSIGLGVTAYFMYHSFDKAIHGSQLKTPHRAIHFERWWQGKSNLPLYRNNRFGRPIAVLNIQWAMPLAKIKALLKQHGWQEVQHNHLSNRVKRLMTEKSKPISLFQQLHHNRAPVLLMTQANKVIRLWDANMKFYESTLPLWIGSVSLLSDEPNGLSGYKTPKKNYPAMALMQHSLQDLSINVFRPKDDVEVLYIKPTPRALDD